MKLIIKDREELFEIKNYFESINRKQAINMLMLKRYHHYFKSLFILGDLKMRDVMYFMSNIVSFLVMVFCAVGVYFDKVNFVLLPISFVLYSIVVFKIYEQIVDMKNRIILNPLNQAKRINQFLQIFHEVFDPSFKINDVSELALKKEKIACFINDQKEMIKDTLDEKEKENVDHVFLLIEDRNFYFDHTSDFIKNKKVFGGFLFKKYLTSPYKDKALFFNMSLWFLVVLSGVGFMHYSFFAAVLSTILLSFALIGLSAVVLNYENILFDDFLTHKIDKIELDLLKNTSIAFKQELICENKKDVFDLYWDGVDSLLKFLKTR